jgi:hypothetical protein
LELQSHTPSKGTKEIYCTPTKQNGKDKEAVTLRQRFKKLFRLELQRYTQSKGTKGNLLQTYQAKRQRIKKRSRCFVFDVD